MGKRESDKELTDRNWDDEDESVEPEGEFKKASEEVLATRRIIKAKRSNVTPAAEPVVAAPPVAAPVVVGGQLQFPTFGAPPAAAPAPASPPKTTEAAAAAPATSPPPAAAAAAVTSPPAAATPAAAAASPAVTSPAPAAPAPAAAAASSPAPAPFTWPPATGAAAPAGAGFAWPPAGGGGAFKWPPAATPAPAIPGPDGAAKPFTGFQWPTLSTDGATKPFGFGSATPGFSFPTVPPPQKKEGAAEAGKEEEEDVAEENPAASIFRKEDAVVHLDEVEVVTGEEDEEKVFEVRGKLFRLQENAWLERGLGHLRVNLTKGSDKPSARIVMRGDGAVGVMLNTPLWASMTIEKAAEKAVRFTAIIDGKPAIHLLRVSNGKDAESLVQAVKDTLAKLN